MEEDQKRILIAQSKWLFKRQLFGHVSSGGGIIPLEFGYAIKFIANEGFTQINLIQVGKGEDIPSQAWQKSVQTKLPKPKKKEKGTIEYDDQDKEEDLL